MEKSVIVGGEKIEGNISNCEIKNEIVLIDRKSVWSLHQRVTYQPIVTCTGEMLQPYVVKESTDKAMVCFFIILLLVCLVAWFADAWFRRW